MYRFICVSAIAGLLGSALLAQQDDPKTASSLSTADQTFIQDAASINQTEVALGPLAQKSSNPRVKAFGRRLEADHSKAQKELESLAAAKGVALERFDSSKSPEYGKLSAMSGAEFDRAFATQMVEGHKKAIALYEQALKTTRDPDLRTYINNTLPALRTHLREAETLQRSLGKG